VMTRGSLLTEKRVHLQNTILSLVNSEFIGGLKNRITTDAVVSEKKQQETTSMSCFLSDVGTLWVPVTV
jgi:hypothetical protein